MSACAVLSGNYENCIYKSELPEFRKETGKMWKRGIVSQVFLACFRLALILYQWLRGKNKRLLPRLPQRNLVCEGAGRK